MERKPLSVTTRDTWSHQSFDQTTCEDGDESYRINGELVDKTTWSKRAQKAQEEEIRATAGEEVEP